MSAIAPYLTVTPHSDTVLSNKAKQRCEGCVLEVESEGDDRALEARDGLASCSATRAS